MRRIRWMTCSSNANGDKVALLPTMKIIWKTYSTLTTTTVVLRVAQNVCKSKCDKSKMRVFALLSLLGSASPVLAWTPSFQQESNDASRAVNDRRQFLGSLVSAGSAMVAGSVLVPSGALAEPSSSDRLNLSDEQLKQIVKQDLLERQFLVTGNLTPSIYKPTATFTDEIDTYQMDQWMKGTQALFVGEKSDVRLMGDVEVSPDKVEFRFDEDLMFRIPFRPTVSLSGKVILTRDDTGFITSYREFWDQDVLSVLKTAKF